MNWTKIMIWNQNNLENIFRKWKLLFKHQWEINFIKREIFQRNILEHWRRYIISYIICFIIQVKYCKNEVWVHLKISLSRGEMYDNLFCMSRAKHSKILDHLKISQHFTVSHYRSLIVIYTHRRPNPGWGYLW